MITKKFFLLVTFIFFTSFLYSHESSAQSNPAVTENINTFLVPVVGNSNFAEQSLIDIIEPIEIPIIGNKIKTPPVAKTVPAPQIQTHTGKPKRLTIPALNIDVDIEHIGLTKEGAVGVPKTAYSVSWFSAGAIPGDKGSAVISGHSGRWKDGNHSIFDSLPNLKAGDIIYVKNDTGAIISFTVKETRVYDKNETVPEIFNKSDRAYLNIITCYGNYIESEKTYSKRLVVFAQAN